VQRTISLAYKDKKSFTKAYTGNISAGGLFIKTQKPLKKGETFLLKLQLSGLPEPLKINCEVVWSRGGEEASETRPPGMGVKFGTMSQTDKKILEKYLRDM